MPVSTFKLKMMLRINEHYFRQLRCAAGDLRQRKDNASAIQIQRLCGEIETSLYKARQAL